MEDTTKRHVVEKEAKALNIVTDISVSTLTKENVSEVIELIRRNFLTFEEAGTVLRSTFLRLENLHEIYFEEGARMQIVKLTSTDELIACIGLGPLAGLPPSERIGEIREFVVDKSYQNMGLGAYLLELCLVQARDLGYRRLYLATTPQMKHAQKLFMRFGFRPVIDKSIKVQNKQQLPCYYMLEDL
ncbi:MAG: GNAT family N-acetyltransferase [Oligoflexales bacterium]